MVLVPKLKPGNQDGIKPPQESVNCRPFFNGGSFFSPRRRLGRFPRLNQGRRVDAVNDAWNSTYGKRCPRFAGTMDHRPPARVESPGDRSRRRAVRLLGRRHRPGPSLDARTGPRVDLAALPATGRQVSPLSVGQPSVPLQSFAPKARPTGHRHRLIVAVNRQNG